MQRISVLCGAGTSHSTLAPAPRLPPHCSTALASHLKSSFSTENCCCSRDSCSSFCSSSATRAVALARSAARHSCSLASAACVRSARVAAIPWCRVPVSTTPLLARLSTRQVPTSHASRFCPPHGKGTRMASVFAGIVPWWRGRHGGHGGNESEWGRQRRACQARQPRVHLRSRHGSWLPPSCAWQVREVGLQSQLLEQDCPDSERSRIDCCSRSHLTLSRLVD